MTFVLLDDAPESLILETSMACCDKCSKAVLAARYDPKSICAIDNETYDKLYITSDGGVSIYPCVDECGIWLSFDEVIDNNLFESPEKYFEIVEKVGGLRVTKQDTSPFYFSTDNILFMAPSGSYLCKGLTYEETYKNFLQSNYEMKPVHQYLRSKYKARARWG